MLASLTCVDNDNEWEKQQADGLSQNGAGGTTASPSRSIP